RVAVDQCHFAKDPARLHDFNDLVAEPDFYFALVDHEHEAARIALTENRFTGMKNLNRLLLEHVERGHNKTGFEGMLGNRFMTSQCRQCYNRVTEVGQLEVMTHVTRACAAVFPMKRLGSAYGSRKQLRDFAIPRDLGINMQQLARYSARRKSTIPRNRAELRSFTVRICPKNSRL